MDLASKLFKGDRVIWIIFMFLCLISVVEVFSATSTIAYKNANYWAPIIRHATFLVVGFFFVLIIHNLPIRFSVILGLLAYYKFVPFWATIVSTGAFIAGIIAGWAAKAWSDKRKEGV